MKYVQLNEGLKVLGSDNRQNSASYDGVFEDSALESAVLPSTLKMIERDAFGSCKKLKDITLPNGLETICLGAFCNSGLERIVFPASLRTLA